MESIIQIFDIINRHLKPFAEVIEPIANYSWNLPLIMLLVGTGALFTFALWFVQIRRFRHAIHIIKGDYDDPDDEGDITHFQALCAALSATIGVGNIAGVATALHLGGPGAIFWMWVTAFVGMATKYATCLLSQKYRYVHEDGSVSGGPMYYIEMGLGTRFKWLAILFAFCAAVASFGGGNMVQSNSMTVAFVNYFGNPRLTENLPVERLNDGRGIRETQGVDFVIHTRSGQSLKVDIHQPVLFSLDSSLKDELNREEMPKKIQEAFKNRQIVLSNKTKVTKIKENEVWNIADNGRNWTVKREGLKITGYQEETLSDLLAKVNDHPGNRGRRIRCEFKGSRFIFQDLTRGDGSFEMIPKGPTFAELGIDQLRGDGKSMIYSHPLEKDLLSINGGRGLSDFAGPDLSFKLKDGSSFEVDIAGVTKTGDLVERINSHSENYLVKALIHLDQKHLRFKDLTGGKELFHLEPYSATLSDLGFRLEGSAAPRKAYTRPSPGKLTMGSPLVDLNGGKEIRQGQGADFKIKLHDDTVLSMDVEGLVTVGDFIERINAHEANSDKARIRARITDNSVVMVDLTMGKGSFELLGYSSTLEDLWFKNKKADADRPYLIQNITPDRTLWKMILGLLIAGLVWLVIVGGIKRIGQVASKLVPFMCILYVLGALIILFRYASEIPSAFGLIFYHAFNSTEAVGGGFAGATVVATLTWGVRRAIFSNEAGLGSAPIAHAAAKTKEPVREGLVAMVGPFVDTIVICTMTALVIIVTNQWQLGETSSALTQDAFTVGLPFGGIGGAIVALGLILFAFSTSISWSYYGDRSVEYLFGERAITPYRWIFCGFLFLGAIWRVDAVWAFADVTMAAMAFPNLIGTLALSGVVIAMTRDYFGRKHVPYWETEKGQERKAEKEKAEKEKAEKEKAEDPKSEKIKEEKTKRSKAEEKKPGKKKNKRKKGGKKKPPKD